MSHRRATRLGLVLANAAVFFGGLAVSCLSFEPYRAQGWPALIISDVQSPEENPHGYGYSAVATAVSGALLLPLVAGLHRQLSPWRRRTTTAGSVALTIGAGGAIAIGVLAPFPVSYDSVHVPLAFATFIAIVAGLSSYVAVLVTARGAAAPHLGWSLRVCLAVQALLVPFLAYLYFVPDFFDGRTLWTTLAFLEWSLCAGILGMLVLIVVAVDN